MKLLLPFVENRPDSNNRLTGFFLAAGGKDHEVFRWMPAADTSHVLLDHLGNVCDVQGVLAGTVFNEPELATIVRECVDHGFNGVLLRDDFRKRFEDIHLYLDLIFVKRDCVKNRVGNHGTFEEFANAPKLDERGKALVAGIRAAVELVTSRRCVQEVAS